MKLSGLKERGFPVLNFLKKNSTAIVYVITAAIIWFAARMRTLNLGFLKDVTTGKYIPMALDPFLFMRYGREFVETGSFMAHDFMRAAPFGNPVDVGVKIIPVVTSMLYKIMSIFSGSATYELANVLYPVIFFVLSMIVFFFLVKKLFNKYVAMISTAFLSFIPSFLYRTTAGFSDKEALGIFFMFLTFYLFTFSWDAKTMQRALLFGGLTGISTALMAFSWGGFKFIFLIFGLFALIEWFLHKLKRNDYLAYSSWLVVSLLVLVSTSKYALTGFLRSITSAVAVFVFVLFIVEYLSGKFSLMDKIKRFVPRHLPDFILKLVLAIILVVLTSTILYGPSFLFSQFSQVVDGLLRALSGGRVALTVAEQRVPYVIEWFSEMGKLFFFAFFIGSIMLFFKMMEPVKKGRKALTTMYALFLVAFIFSRYSASSIFNGDTFISSVFYIGSLIVFALIIAVLYIRAHYKDLDLVKRISDIEKKYIFVFVWFIVMIVAARSAIRLLFVFSPIISLMTGYFIYSLYEHFLKVKNIFYKIVFVAIILSLIILPVNGSLLTFSKASYGAASHSGPSYSQQWQYGMQWVREDTPKDSTFAHWWDYGYWVQTGGERATITDGGHPVGHWDYLMGRHVLTGQSELEALEFLYAHNTTHLLMISDEIGKYSAYSSIGSDENYDRYSWISTFVLDGSQSVERRDDVLLVYTGGSVLDEDLIWQDTVLPGRSAGIGAFLLPMARDGDQVSFSQPSAAVIYNGKQFDVPINCIYFNGEEINWPGEEGLNGCLRIIPEIVNDNQQDPFGAAMYISERVRRTLFSNLFLMDKESDYFKLAYPDENAWPLALYGGRLIGPLKIWEVSYPEDIVLKEEYLAKE
ncbi:hypothetical protein HOF78_03805 [Candidatus Woesearchaeota archaeon]|jgi:asparagine N-glycosylation enzyme membrane subunit Stt3|nr:hypothetical protein [Candidatus Woesearchaeota archaeon]MBT6044731.1 hypothetical protein [Candidatus Woesearchaeota archaeon]